MASENALERFVRKTRDLFAKEEDPEKRWTSLSPALAELLADPEVMDASKNWPECIAANGRAENLLFYEDPDFGFAVNGLTKGPARFGAPPRSTTTRTSTRCTGCWTATSASSATNGSTTVRSLTTPRSARQQICT